jgi:orotate phosphoribosyltransferase-like protein
MNNEPRNEIDAYEFKKIIRLSSAYDKKSKWLSLNNLWYSPKYRGKYISIVMNFLGDAITWSDKHVLLVLDGAASTSGLIPIIGQFTEEVGCRLAIWKEMVPVSISESWLLPSRLDKHLNCVLLQDVVSKGSTLRRVAADVNLARWKVEGFFALVKVDKFSEAFEDNIKEFKKSVNCTDSFKTANFLNISELDR